MAPLPLRLPPRAFLHAQRRGYCHTPSTHSTRANEAKAKIEAYFAAPEKWSDPWTACLSDYPPTPRECEPAVDWTDAGNHIIDTCNSVLMAKDAFHEAMEVRAKIEKCLQEQTTESNLMLFTFGSCMSGLATQTSDLDLVIMRCDNDGKPLNPTTRDEQLAHFNDYLHMLEDTKGGIFPKSELKLIQARVPILRREVPSGVNCDISLFFHGVRNSVLLREYARTCPFFMPMSIVLREWGKQVGICNSLGGYLTPYCMNVMIIKYLVQEVSEDFMVPMPPLLPPVYYPKYPSQYLPPPREMQRREKRFVKELGLHIAGFLRYYAVYSWLDKVVSAADPIKDSRDESPLWADDRFKSVDVIIEEMFSQQDKSLPIPNMAGKVDAIKLLNIRELMMYSYFHVMHHGYLPAEPQDMKSPAWKPGMPSSKPQFMFQ